ncbi:MAG: extracellular solute-binding protein, partial [Clostridia bacterium]|nr:extracellular solute-binding protein [Clostridia bacterium]
MKKKIISLALTAALLLPSLALFSGCSGDDTVILRVYNWEEYIDDGGEGSYVYDTLKEELAPEMSHKAFQKWYKKEYGTQLAPSIIDDFEDWYEDTYGKPIRVEYSTFGTNEDMYNQLKLGVTFDLVCPSEYMIMKLIAEDMLEPLSDEFFVEDNELNYYLNNVSEYIAGVFAEERELDGKTYQLEKYAAGYMWGTTGFIYNPEKVDFTENAYWNTLLDTNYKNKVTTKDNVRDSYFVGLAIVHQKELLALKEQYENGEITREDYNEQVTHLMNDTSAETVKKVQDTLIKMKSNLYGFETDSGKQDMVTGKIWINFAWSGDAVYAMDLAEEQGVELNYYIPDECANLFFDGWVMPKGANHQAAEAFINFLSMPENAVRNMYYIGYTSAIAGDEVFEYVED